MALTWRLTGGTGETNPSNSLGGEMSSGELSATALNNLFDNVAAVDAAAGEVSYRALSLYAPSGEDYETIDIYMNPETPSAYTQIDMAFEGKEVGDGTSVVNEATLPDKTGCFQ